MEQTFLITLSFVIKIHYTYKEMLYQFSKGHLHQCEAVTAKKNSSEKCQVLFNSPIIWRNLESGPACELVLTCTLLLTQFFSYLWLILYVYFCYSVTLCNTCRHISHMSTVCCNCIFIQPLGSLTRACLKLTFHHHKPLYR